MSINSGNYGDMAIKTSIVPSSGHFVEHGAVQIFLVHLLASNLLVFLLVLYQLWNEIFGGLFFGVFRRQSFVIICKFFQLVCLPLYLLCFRRFYTLLSDTGARTTLLFYGFFLVQGVAISGLALYINARALLVILACICLILLQLLIMYSCCRKSKYERNRISRIVSVLLASMIFAILLCDYNWKFQHLHMMFFIFACLIWYYYRLIFTLENLVHFMDAYYTGPNLSITPSTLLVSFYLDIYFFLFFEYACVNAGFMFLSCMGVERHRRFTLMTKCRGGIYYYPFSGIVSGEVIEGPEGKPEADIENEKSSLLHREEYKSSTSEGDLESLSEASDEKENDERFVPDLEEKSDAMEETLESLKNSLHPDDSNNDDFSSDTDSEKLSKEASSSSNISSSGNFADASKSMKSSLTDMHLDRKLNEYLSAKIESLRKVNRILNSFLLLHEDGSKNDYELLLYSLYSYSRQLGDLRDEFSQITWRHFGSELKKYDKASTLKFRSGLKLRKSKKKKRIEISFPNMEQMDTIYLWGSESFTTEDSSIDLFLLFRKLWQKLAEETFFTATVYDAEVKLTMEFGIPMINALSKSYNMELAREKCTSRVIKSDAVMSIFRHHRQLLKSIFVKYAPLVPDSQTKTGKKLRVLSMKNFFYFCDDFTLSNSSSPTYVKLSRLRKLFNLATTNTDKDAGCNFGQFRLLIFKVAVEVSSPLHMKVSSGGIKAGEAARALGIFLNLLARSRDNNVKLKA